MEKNEIEREKKIFSKKKLENQSFSAYLPKLNIDICGVKKSRFEYFFVLFLFIGFNMQVIMLNLQCIIGKRTFILLSNFHEKLILEGLYFFDYLFSKIIFNG